MKITFGEKSIELRDWPGGKMLLMTRNEQVKDAFERITEEEPGVVELLTDPDAASPDDLEDVAAIIVDRRRSALVFDLDNQRIGVAVYTDMDDEPDDE